MLDEHSELGPIDPQFNIRGMASPARGILRQFEEAAREIAESPGRLPAWVPILQQYAPSLLEDAREAWDQAIEMVRGWLESYMFAGESDAAKRASEIAEYFGARDEERRGTHGRPIGIDKAIQLGVRVRDLRKDHELRRKVRDLHHADDLASSMPTSQAEQEHPEARSAPAKLEHPGA